jgi:predicted ester cyclase
MNDAEKNKELVARMYDGLNDHVIEGMEAFWHEDMVWYGPAGIGTLDGIKGFQEGQQRPFLHAFSNKKAHDDIRIAEGDFVAASGYQFATHSGEWLGIPASGKRIKIRYMDFWRVDGDKLKENWVLINLLDEYVQLGIEIFERMRRSQVRDNDRI